jgi:hypothetical protein
MNVVYAVVVRQTVQNNRALAVVQVVLTPQLIIIIQERW